MYASVAFALRGNNVFLHSTSKAYWLLVKKAKQKPTHEEDAREINFAVGQTAKILHTAKTNYRMPALLKEEIAFIHTMLMVITVHLSTPLGHIVSRDPTWSGAADSCKRSGGGWSVDLSFWQHLVYSAEVFRRASLPNNSNKLLISINVLKMVSCSC